MSHSFSDFTHYWAQIDRIFGKLGYSTEWNAYLSSFWWHLGYFLSLEDVQPNRTVGTISHCDSTGGAPYVKNCLPAHRETANHSPPFLLHQARSASSGFYQTNQGNVKCGLSTFSRDQLLIIKDATKHIGLPRRTRRLLHKLHLWNSTNTRRTCNQNINNI